MRERERRRDIHTSIEAQTHDSAEQYYTQRERKREREREIHTNIRGNADRTLLKCIVTICLWNNIRAIAYYKRKASLLQDDGNGYGLGRIAGEKRRLYSIFIDNG